MMSVANSAELASKQEKVNKCATKFESRDLLTQPHARRIFMSRKESGSKCGIQLVFNTYVYNVWKSTVGEIRRVV